LLISSAEISVGALFTRYWPVLLIIWGIDELFNEAGYDKKKTGGWLLIILGAVILGRNIGFYQLDFSILWKAIGPLFIIFIGLTLLQGRSSVGRNRFVVMSGLEFTKNAWDLKDETFTIFMGGIDMDLSLANIPEKETILIITTIMGGMDIKVPQDLEVECVSTSILGGVSFFGEGSGGIIANKRSIRKGAEGSTRRVKIFCTSIMGGIDIKAT
jgi:hypothetical protein